MRKTRKKCGKYSALFCVFLSTFSRVFAREPFPSIIIKVFSLHIVLTAFSKARLFALTFLRSVFFTDSVDDFFFSSFGTWAFICESPLSLNTLFCEGAGLSTCFLTE